ncbi:MAG: NUDIX hydrolase [Paracoccaceae bacterium]
MTDEILTLGSKIVYENNWMKLREDNIRYPDGHESIYGYVDKPNFSLIVAVHADGSVQMVEQFRYPVRCRQWEFPMGVWDGKPGATPLESAQAELREETGLRAKQMELFANFFPTPGLATQTCHMFLATELTTGKPCREVEEQGMITKAFMVDEILQMITSGLIKDATTISAIGYLRLLGRI